MTSSACVRRGADAEGLESVAVGVRDPAHGAQDRVEGNRFDRPGAVDDQPLLAVDDVDAHGPPAESQLEALGDEARLHHGGAIVVLGRQQARRLLDDGDAGAEPGERLCQLAANRSAAEDDQARRQLAQRSRPSRRSAASTSASPGIDGTIGRAPVAITIARVVSVRDSPSRV